MVLDHPEALMFPSPFRLAFIAFALGLPALISPAQELPPEPPPRPESRIHDSAAVFELGNRPAMAATIRERLDALHLETDCDILIATVTTSTGTTPRLLVDQFAATWLRPDQRGAVLVYERAGNRLGISATQSSLARIADYDLAAIEQSLAGNREGLEIAEAISLATNDLAALFRLNFGESANREHPSIKADRTLFGVLAAVLVVLLVVVATLHWRGEKARA